MMRPCASHTSARSGRTTSRRSGGCTSPRATTSWCAEVGRRRGRPTPRWRAMPGRGWPATPTATSAPSRKGRSVAWSRPWSAAGCGTCPCSSCSPATKGGAWGALLDRALAYGEARGSEIRCTSATLDPRAQARYVMAGMAPRWPIYRLDGDAAAVTRLKARAGLDPRERELPCDPGAAEKLTAEVFCHGRADDLAHFRGDGGAAVAIERGGELAAFAYRRGERIGPAAGRDETAFLQAVAAAANAGGGGNVTVRVPGACASLLAALVGCGFRIGELAVFLASRAFGRPGPYPPARPL